MTTIAAPPASVELPVELDPVLVRLEAIAYGLSELGEHLETTTPEGVADLLHELPKMVSLADALQGELNHAMCDLGLLPAGYPPRTAEAETPELLAFDEALADAAMARVHEIRAAVEPRRPAVRAA